MNLFFSHDQPISYSSAGISASACILNDVESRRVTFLLLHFALYILLHSHLHVKAGPVLSIGHTRFAIGYGGLREVIVRWTQVTHLYFGHTKRRSH